MQTKLTLKNFMMHKNTELNLGKVNWIVGLEKNGKTNCLCGVEIAHWRRCEYINDGGEGISELIRRGAKKAEVTLEGEGGSILKATIPSNAKDCLEENFDKETIKACLRNKYLLQMKETEQKAFFQKLLLGSSGFNRAMIEEKLNTYHPDFPDLGTRFMTFAEGVNRDDIKELLDCAKEGRRDAKKEVTRIENSPPEKPPEGVTETTRKEVGKA